MPGRMPMPSNSAPQPDNIEGHNILHSALERNLAHQVYNTNFNPHRPRYIQISISEHLIANECLVAYMVQYNVRLHSTTFFEASSSHQKRAQVELENALGEFKQGLSPDQAAQLISFSSQTPTADDVVRLTEQVTRANDSRKSRLFAKRIQGLLGSIQQYCTIIDTYVGPNQIAAVIWGSIKIVLLVCTPGYPISSPILKLTVPHLLGLFKFCRIL